MKRIISLALAALLTASLCACGGPASQTSEIPSGPIGESASVPPGDTPSPEPSEEPSEEVPAGPGRVDLAAFAQTVQETHGFSMMIRNDPADEEQGAILLNNYYPGLMDMDLEQVEVYLAANSYTSVELSLVQAKNAGDAAAVKDIFQARVDSMTKPGGYPEAEKLWQLYAEVESNGNYVLLVAHEDSAAVVSEFNGLFQ